MDQEDIKDVDLEEDEDIEFTKKKKSKAVGIDDDLDGGIKDPFDDEFIGDDEGFDEEDGGFYLNGDEEEADTWDDVYGFKDEYES